MDLIVRGSNEILLTDIKNTLVKNINAGEENSDYGRDILHFLDKQLILREKIILLNIIALSAPTKTVDLSPAGRLIFDDVVEEISNILPNGTSILEVLCFDIPYRTEGKWVIDIHPTEDGDVRNQFKGVGFTYFFLDRASSIQNGVFPVCPGVGNNTRPENKIQGLCSTRYGVIRYLEDLQSKLKHEIENDPAMNPVNIPRIQAIKAQLSISRRLDNRFLDVHSKEYRPNVSRLNSQGDLEALVHHVTQNCLQNQHSSARLTDAPRAFGDSIQLKSAKELSPNQLKKQRAKAKKAEKLACDAKLSAGEAETLHQGNGSEKAKGSAVSQSTHTLFKSFPDSNAAAVSVGSPEKNKKQISKLG